MSQPAGWYPQPDGTQRYWDGQGWTEHTAPGAATATATSPPEQVAGPSQFGSSQAPIPPVKPKKPVYQRVWFWLVIVFVVLPVIGSMLGRGNPSAASPAAPTSSAATSEPSASGDETAGDGDETVTPEPEPQEKVAKIGDTIRVGDLAVTVKSAERKTVLRSVFGSKKGRWMVVEVKVANKGKDQVMVNDSDFTLLESDGTSYGTDSDGMTYIDSDEWLFLKKINPKTSATGTILFTLPKSAKNLTLQASGGLFGMQTGEVSLGGK